MCVKQGIEKQQYCLITTVPLGTLITNHLDYHSLSFLYFTKKVVLLTQVFMNFISGIHQRFFLDFLLKNPYGEMKCLQNKCQYSLPSVHFAQRKFA